MKPRILDLLVCPIGKSHLELEEWGTVPTVLSDEQVGHISAIGLDPSSFSKDILTGLLVNRARKIFYPIYRGVPRLLVFPTDLTREFVKVHAKRLADGFPGFHLPHETPPPGEEDVLRSFSNEWLGYEWNPNAYWNLNSEDMYRSMRFLLDLDHRPVNQKLVLEVGIGIGGIADSVSRSEECEMVGIDLSYAVDAAYKNFGQSPLLHIVSCRPPSLHYPFRRTCLISSTAKVIMSTYSTKTAFDQLARLPKIGGRLYVWVYSPYDEERTLERRILMKIERVIRPVLWRLPESLQTVALVPIVPLYLLHQNVYMRHRDKRYVRYGWREAIHSARDRFTPRYAYRHTEEEVCGWFHEAGYVKLQCVSKRERPEFIPISLVAATAVDEIRCQVRGLAS